MMIRHIVMFRLADKSGENIAKTAEILRSMEGRVPMLRGIEVGHRFFCILPDRATSCFR